MHRFYFHLYDSDQRVADEEGRLLPSFEMALIEAVAAARGVLAEEVRRGHFRLARHIEITDSYGIPLMVLPFDEAVTVQLAPDAPDRA